MTAGAGYDLLYSAAGFVLGILLRIATWTMRRG